MSRVHVIVAEEGSQAFTVVGRWIFSGPEPERAEGGNGLLAEAFVSRLAKHLNRDHHPACRVAEPIRETSCALVPLEGTCLSSGAQEGTKQSPQEVQA